MPLSVSDSDPDKYKVLTNLVSSQVYRYLADLEDYDSAIGTLGLFTWRFK